MFDNIRLQKIIYTFAVKTMFFVQALSSPIKCACHFICSTIAGSVYPWKVLGIYTFFPSNKNCVFLLFENVFFYFLVLDSHFFKEKRMHACCFCCEIRGAVCEKHCLDLVRSCFDTIGSQFYFWKKCMHAFCFCFEICQAVREKHFFHATCACASSAAFLSNVNQ